MTSPHIAIIIINYNGKLLLTNCLKSLAKLVYPKSKLLIIMVDNGSTDGSLQSIKQKNIKIIKNSSNLGFSKANNQGIHYALKNNQIKYLWLLNNDTIVHPKALINSIKFMQSKKTVGAIVGKLLQLNEPKKIDSAGDFFHYPSYRVFNRGHDEIDQNQFEKPQKCLSACAASAVYLVSALKKAQIQNEFLDQNFGSYIEDVDLSIRLRLLGYQIYYLPSAITYHQGSATSSRLHKNYKEYLSRRNRLLFVIKNFPAKYALFLLYKYLTPSFIGIKNHFTKQYNRTRRQGFKHYQAKGFKFYSNLLIKRYYLIINLTFIQFKAIIATLPLLPLMFYKRHLIQQKKVINNAEVASWFKKYITYG